MNASPVLTIAGVEARKIVAQLKVRIVLITCVAGPVLFAVAMRVQSTVPSDTLFGRAAAESGFAVPLAVLGFAALWVLPVLASVVGGDLFAAEDRHGTWATILTRSRSRTEVFAAKVLTALTFSTAAVTVLALSSIAAGLFVVGSDPLIDLTGDLLSPRRALVQIALAWASILPPVFAFTAVAILISVAMRSSAAGIGLPVLAAFVMQLSAFVDGPDLARRLMITSGFDAWHGLLATPPYYGPLAYGVAVSTVSVIVCLTVAHGLLRRRDIGG